MHSVPTRISRPHSGPILCAAVSRCERALATGGKDTTVRVSEIANFDHEESEQAKAGSRHEYALTSSLITDQVRSSSWRFTTRCYEPDRLCTQLLLVGHTKSVVDLCFCEDSAQGALHGSLVSVVRKSLTRIVEPHSKQERWLSLLFAGSYSRWMVPHALGPWVLTRSLPASALKWCVRAMLSWI